MMQIGKAWKRLIVYQPDSTLTERKVTPFPRDDDRDYRGHSQSQMEFRTVDHLSDGNPTEHSGGERFEGHQRTTTRRMIGRKAISLGLFRRPNET
jgi:hypothetical protein